MADDRIVVVAAARPFYGKRFDGMGARSVELKACPAVFDRKDIVRVAKNRGEGRIAGLGFERGVAGRGKTQASFSLA